MGKIRIYFMPALISLLVFVFLMSVRQNKESCEDQDRPRGILSLPGGRVFYTVVEQEGAYVGDTFVPVEQYSAFLESRKKMLNASYAIVIGTKSSRYGDVVKVFGAIRKQLDVPGTIETRPANEGTRKPVIAVYEHFWQY